MKIKINLKHVVNHLSTLKVICPKTNIHKYDYFYFNFERKYMYFCGITYFGKVKFDYEIIENEYDKNVPDDFFIRVYKFFILLQRLSEDNYIIECIINDKAPIFYVNGNKFFIDHKIIGNSLEREKAMHDMIIAYDDGKFYDYEFNKVLNQKINEAAAFIDKNVQTLDSIALTGNKINVMATTRMYENILESSVDLEKPLLIHKNTAKLITKFKKDYHLKYNETALIFNEKDNFDVYLNNDRCHTIIPKWENSSKDAEDGLINYISMDTYIDIEAEELLTNLSTLNYFYAEDSKPVKIEIDPQIEKNELQIGYSGDDDIVELKCKAEFISPEIRGFSGEFNAVFLKLGISYLYDKKNKDSSILRFYLNKDKIGGLLTNKDISSNIYDKIDKKVILIQYS